jgi:hypothetical protein
MTMPLQKKLARLWTPAGKASSVVAGAPPQKSNTKKVFASGSFAVDAANAPSDLRGDPHAAARTGVGAYEVSLGALTDLLGRYKITEFLHINVNLGSAAASSLVAEPAAETPASGKFGIRVVNKATGAAANPPAAGASERISWSVCFNVGAP